MFLLITQPTHAADTLHCAAPSLHRLYAASQNARVGVASPPRIPPSVFG